MKADAMERIARQADRAKLPHYPAVDVKSFQYIGQIVVHWAYLEDELDGSIQAMLYRAKCDGKLSEQRALDMIVPIKRRVRYWKELAPLFLKSDEVLKLFAGIAARVLQLREARDLIVHGRWGVGYDRKTRSHYASVYRMRYTREPKLDSRRVDTEHLKSFGRSNF